ncbi:MAG: hypothetical protein V2A76_12085 [Planctomycetota bacterium]
MQLTFNVIYTPGTVRSLRYFVPTLTRWTDCRFRLVANGCSEQEQQQLERLAGTNDQLEYYQFPSKKIQNHGIVVSHLLGLDSSEFFAFMDSDIFAVGDFAAEMAPYLEEHAAFFSGRPIWSNAADQVAAPGVRFCGPHNRSEGGVCVGSTYFAVYHRRPLERLIDEEGVTFEKVISFEDVPERCRAPLEQMGCRTDTYEVGKLINLLLQVRGERIQYLDLASIRHVGGLSLLAKKRIDKKPYINVEGEQAYLAKDYSEKIRPWMPRKRFTCHYLSEYMSAALEGREYDGPLLIEDQEVRGEVLTTARQLGELCRESRELFARLDGDRRLSVRWKSFRRSLFSSRGPLKTEGLYVLGMHRSGTSCLTGLLETAGLWIGNAPRRSNWNAKGNLEDQDIRVLNEKVFGKLGGSWKEPVEDLPAGAVKPERILEVLKPYRRHRRWLVKDPRLLFTMSLWLPHTPQRRLVGTFRHPYAVARSLLRRNAMPLEEGVALWVTYNRQLVALHRQLQFPLMNFDLKGEPYLDRFRHLCGQLDLPYDDKAAREFYETSLVNQGLEPSDQLEGEAEELYSYLLEHQVAAQKEHPTDR